tara:strand:+ start:562 stop:753 length:192 start_codon:yes stop_codon:yes gene_type:complete
MSIKRNLSEIRNIISEYLEIRDPISTHTLKCFIGMIETKEATIADFAFFSADLADKVRNAIDA